MTREKTQEALCDVRKAYRLIFAYQRRVLDSIRLLTQEYEVLYGGPKFAGRPKFKRFEFDRWSWDYLPLYQTIFKFRINAEYELSIYINADNGFFLKDRGNHLDRTNLNRFEDAENSNSYITLIVANDHYNHEQRIALNNKLIANRLTNIELNGEHFIAKRYDLEDLIDVQSIKALRANFKSYCFNINPSLKIFS